MVRSQVAPILKVYTVEYFIVKSLVHTLKGMDNTFTKERGQILQ